MLLNDLNCPRCGWPVTAEPIRSSSHPTMTGAVRYLQCVCGCWLLLHNGELLATAGR